MTKILFERTGGFAGLRIATTIELEALEKEEAKALYDLLDEADFFDLPEFQPARPVPDEFNYVITVESDKRRHTIHTSDTTASDELRALLNELSRRARQRRI
jgi:hypothetical protein